MKQRAVGNMSAAFSDMHTSPGKASDAGDGPDRETAAGGRIYTDDLEE